MYKYITINEPNLTAFTNKLNELGKQGYEPIGSITKEGGWFFIIVEKSPLHYETKDKPTSHIIQPRQYEEGIMIKGGHNKRPLTEKPNFSPPGQG